MDASDPKGIAGDPGFEMAAFLRNPEEKSAAGTARRLDILCADLSLDRARVRDWCVAEQTLNAAWSHDDNPARFAHKLERAQMAQAR